MIYKTARGLDLTATNEHTVGLLDQFTQSLLGFSDQTGDLALKAAEDERSPVAQAFACMVWLSSDTVGGRLSAQPYLQRAISLVDEGTDREKQIVEATRHWAQGNLRKAATTLDTLLSDYPNDILCAKICQGMYFDLGDASGILRAPLKIASECSDSAYTHGMLAFGYEECDLLEDAENAALKAIEMKRKEPWAQHAYAHVCEARGHYEKGASFMEGMSDTWSGLSSFMYTHNWWHLCLSYVDMDQLDDALSVFDTHVWNVDKTCVQDQINAISLLYRLERVGADPGERWSDIANHVVKSASDQISPFLDLQFVYALARAEHADTNAMLDRLAERAKHAHKDEQLAWQQVVCVAAPRIVDLARKQVTAESSSLSEVLPYVAAIGGSIAQRDLMHLFHLDMLLASGSFENARQILEKRRHSRPNVRWIRQSLNTVYEELGMPQIARRYERG